MTRSYEATCCCDINGVLFIPPAVPDIVDNILNLPALPPTQLFDDLYFIGTEFIGTIVLKTDEGLVLIDAMNTAKDGEEIIFKGLKELGLDPMDIKKIIITHGHVDHYGAAKYIKEKTGCMVYMTEIDHKYMREVVVPLGEDRIIQGEASDPGVDVYIGEGDIIRSGNTEIKVVFTPGHTPGGISLIFPVHDLDEEHVVGVWGGTKVWSGTSLADNKSVYDYKNSIIHFMDECAKSGADVSVQAHPFVDYNLKKGIFDGRKKTRDAYGKHPLVMGSERFQIFLSCIKAYATGEVEQIKQD